MVRRQVVNRLDLQLLRPALPIRPLVIGIGEVQPAVGPQPDVVGPVEQLALVVLDHDGDLARRVDPPHLVLFIGAGPEVAVGVEAEAVGSPAGLHEGGELAVGAPLHDPVVGLVGEEDIAVGIGGRSFGEYEPARQDRKLAPRREIGLSAAGAALARYCQARSRRHRAATILDIGAYSGLHELAKSSRTDCKLQGYAMSKSSKRENCFTFTPATI